MKIIEFQLEITDRQVIKVPIGSKFLSARIKNGNICVWAMVNSNVDSKDIIFYLCHTNRPCPDAHFLDTVQLRDEWDVYHIFWSNP